MIKQLLYGLTFVMFAGMAVAACTELSGSDDVSALSLDPIYNETVSSAGTQMSTLSALQATAESGHIMATQVGELMVQNQNLQATIAAMTVMNGGQPQVAAAGAPVKPDYANAALPPAAQTTTTTTTGSSPYPPASAAGGGSTDPDLAAQTVNQINQQGQMIPTSTPNIPAATPMAPMDTTVAQQPVASSPNGILYTQATTSSAVNNADGCASDTVSTFDPSVAEVYMTIVARNVVEGAVFNVQWLRNGELQFDSGGWTADAVYDEICIWFSALGPFQSGNWTAQFTEDGQVVGSHDFYITGEEEVVETTEG